MKLSFTRADRYTSCRFAFIHDYPQDGTIVPDNQSLPLLGGKHFHRLAEKWGKGLASKADTFDRVAFADDLTVKPPKGLPFEVYDDIRDVFTSWVGRTTLEFPDKCRFELMLAFNREWEAVEWDADDVFLRMVIDRVDLVNTPTRIIDYKTTRALQTAKALQQKTYAFGLNLALGDDQRDFEVGEQYVRFPRVPIKFTTLTHDDYKGIGDYYLGLDEEISANEDWEPTINSWCGLCSHTKICPKYQDEIVGTDMEVTTMEQAVKLAEKQFAVEARGKDVKKILQAFAGVHGALQFGDQEYGPVVSSKYDFDPGEMCELLESKGVSTQDTLSMLSMTASALKKGVKKFLPEIESVDGLVDEIGTVNPSQKFTFHKTPK